MCAWIWQQALAWQALEKAIKIVTFVAHNGQEITTTRNQNGTFLCYCSHHKCPKNQGFITIDALQKHMKNLKTTWLGPKGKVRSWCQTHFMYGNKIT